MIIISIPKMARSKSTRKGAGKEIYSIVVDGETEVWYFQLLKQYESLKNVDIKPDLPKKKKLSELYKLVVDHAAEFTKVIWVVDLDVVIKEDREKSGEGKSALQELKEYIDLLEQFDNVYVLINTPCLEYWYLLHLKQTSKYYSSCKDVCKQFKGTILEGYEKTEKYYKTKNIYLMLKPYQSFAIENAKRLGGFDIENYSTGKAGIYKIVELLNL